MGSTAGELDLIGAPRRARWVVYTVTLLSQLANHVSWLLSWGLREIQRSWQPRIEYTK